MQKEEKEVEETQKKKMSLYRISEELREIDSHIEALGGEITPELERRREEIQEMLVAKTDNFVEYLYSLDDDIKAATERIEEMRTYKKHCEAKKERLKGFVKNVMLNLDTRDIQGRLYQFKRQPPRKKVEVVDQALLPDEMLETRSDIRPNKIAIARKLMEGVHVPGARLETYEILKVGTRAVNSRNRSGS